VPLQRELDRCEKSFRALRGAERFFAIWAARSAAQMAKLSQRGADGLGRDLKKPFEEIKLS
jgi:hypothetical protein